MAKYGMLLDLTRCLGCQTCIVACKMARATPEGVNFNGVETVERGEYPEVSLRYRLTMCAHCDEPACESVCPTGAIRKTENGAVVRDNAACIGCNACAGACPYNACSAAGSCDFCSARLAAGEQPLCTEHCPARCRIFGDVEDAKSEISRLIAERGAVRLEGTSIWQILPDDLPKELLSPRRETAGTAEMGGKLDVPAPSGAAEEIRYTHCVMCNSSPKCGIKAVLQEGKIVRIERRDGHPNSNLCAKGLASVQDMYSPDRLLYPVRRTTPKGSGDPCWQRISWDEALGEIAEKLNKVKTEHGADKVLFYAGDPKEPRPILQRLAFSFGSPNYGTESSTCFTASQLASLLMLGRGRAGMGQAVGSMPAPGKTKLAIIWGSNPAWSMPFSMEGHLAAKDSGTRYIVIDPRLTPTVSVLADLHLRPRPGTDCALALCFCRALIESGAYDRGFVEDWSEGFEDYRRLCSEYTVEKTAEICELTTESLEAAIELLVTANGPLAIKTSAAFAHHVNGVNAYRAVLSLVALSGSLDVEGGHRIGRPLSADLAFTLAQTELPRLRQLRVDREDFPVWAELVTEVEINYLPEYIRDGKLRAAFMLGLNALMWPQSHEYQQALAKLDFAVTADFYLNDASHDYVDMVLPAAMSFERSCPLNIVGSKIFLREPIVEPLGEARPDWRICCDVGTALGYGELFFGGGERVEENCLREYLRLLDAGVTLEQLREAGERGIALKSPPLPERQYETAALRQDGRSGFATPSGKLEFSSQLLVRHGLEPLPVYYEPSQSPVSTPDIAREYPLILSTGGRVPMYTHTRHRGLPWLRELMPEPVLRIFPADAEKYGVGEGEPVLVTTQFGELRARAELSLMQKPGCVDIFHGWTQANANELHPRDFDPISGFPSYREGLCKIAAAE